MRQITVKYTGECAACGQTLAEGEPAMYEKSMGIFCPGCEPKETEDIRKFRLAKAERKAEQLEGWAEKREHRASAQLNSHPNIRHDWTFITQPGRIPFRERMNRADERAFESLDKATEMRGRAESLRHVQVAGDAERRREKTREALDSVLGKGSRVVDVFFGAGEIVGVFRKSYRVKFDRGFTRATDKTFVRPLQEEVNRANNE